MVSSFQLASAWLRQGIRLPPVHCSALDEGDNLLPCRTEPPGLWDRVQQVIRASAPTAGGGWRASAGPGLAVDGGTVCFCFARRADYPHEAVSELLQDHPLRLRLRLVSLFCLFGLFQQTLARRFKHLLCYKRVREPVEDNRATIIWEPLWEAEASWRLKTGINTEVH